MILLPPKRVEHLIEIAPSGCWIWQGARSSKSTRSGGYGSVKIDGRARRAHLWIFEHFGGVVPPRSEWAHLCWRTYCVHPWHGRPATHQQNLLETSWTRRRPETCPAGHEFDGVRNRQRICLTCMRLSARHRRAMKHPGAKLVVPTNRERTK